MLVLLAAFGAILTVASPAGAAGSCGRAVIDDWYDNGRWTGRMPSTVTTTRSTSCRGDYSTAQDDIQRALQARKRGEAAPPATADPTPGDEDGSTSGGGASGGGSGGSGTPGAETTETAGPTGDEGVGTEAGGAIGTESDDASSVPIPLLILAGLALLLVAAGCAGFVVRRIQARRLPPSTSS